MTTGGVVPVFGGDYHGAGAASRQVKECLKRIGACAEAVRRAMIATYEAEMNVVVHARSGVVNYTLEPGRLDVAVSDEGPGIADISQAMTEGFSTAPQEARELGFGAGMGLPSIERAADSFEIHSETGCGTFVRFSIALASENGPAEARNSVKAGGACRQCMRCVVNCPTEAMRVRTSGPRILAHLCIDCAACIESCPDRALVLDVALGGLQALEGADVVVPDAFVDQFGCDASFDAVSAALRDLGARSVHVLRPWESALRDAAAQWAAEADARPALVPSCPAVVNLIETRYPSLATNLAPFLSPIDAATQSLWGRRGVLVALCPAMCTAARASGAVPLSAAALRAEVAKRLPRDITRRPGSGDPARPHEADGQKALVIDGLKNVTAALERLERGELEVTIPVEFCACDGGCSGAPTLWSRRFDTRPRASARRQVAGARAVRRQTPYAPRGGVRLDADMAAAIRKLECIDRLARHLPGHDCAACGAPSCRALAEDVVLGRAEFSFCLHWRRDWGTTS